MALYGQSGQFVLAANGARLDDREVADTGPRRPQIRRQVDPALPLPTLADGVQVEGDGAGCRHGDDLDGPERAFGEQSDVEVAGPGIPASLQQVVGGRGEAGVRCQRRRQLSDQPLSVGDRAEEPAELVGIEAFPQKILERSDHATG